MHCLGETCWRFRVVARPDSSVDREDAVNELRLAAVRRGADRIDVAAGTPTEFVFEIEAGSPEAACELVTDIFQPIYGLNWQAEISPVQVWPTGDAARQAAWN
jgi:hypothetical protein